MVWRLDTAAWKAGKGRRNKAALRSIVSQGPPPGIIGYAGDAAVGWCSVAPRESFPFLARSRVLKPLDLLPVWSVSCLFVRSDFRRRGVATSLLRAATRFAYANGALAVEGYPVIPYTTTMPPAFAWTGTVANFEAAGFTQAGSHSSSRPIMRHVRGRVARR